MESPRSLFSIPSGPYASFVRPQSCPNIDPPEENELNSSAVVEDEINEHILIHRQNNFLPRSLSQSITEEDNVSFESSSGENNVVIPTLFDLYDTYAYELYIGLSQIGVRVPNAYELPKQLFMNYLCTNPGKRQQIITVLPQFEVLQSRLNTKSVMEQLLLKVILEISLHFYKESDGPVYQLVRGCILPYLIELHSRISDIKGFNQRLSDVLQFTMQTSFIVLLRGRQEYVQYYEDIKRAYDLKLQGCRIDAFVR